MTEAETREVWINGDDLPWEYLRSVEVRIRQPERPEIRMTLNDERQAQPTYGLTREPYAYEVTFTLRNSQLLETKEQTADSDVLIVRSPFRGHLHGRVILSRALSQRGDRAMVTIRYRDSTQGYIVDQVLQLSVDQESEEWGIPILRNDQRTYSYRVEHQSTGDLSFSSDWTETDLPAAVIGPQRVQEVRLIGLFPASDFVFAKVRLSHSGASGGQKEDLLIHNGEEHRTAFFPDRDEDLSYRYQVTFYSPDGRAHPQPERDTDQEVLVITAPKEDSAPEDES